MILVARSLTLSGMDTYILSYLLRWYVTNNSRTVFTELELWDYLNQVAPSSKKQELMSALTELKNEGYITQFIQDIAFMTFQVRT